MKKKLAKAIAVAMSVCMLGGTVGGAVGCSGGRTDGTIKITAWKSGWGVDWLYSLAEEFEAEYPEYHVEIEASASGGDITTQMPAEGTHDYDLFLGCNSNPETYIYYEVLDEVLDMVNPGETKTVGEKIGPEMLSMLINAEGHYDKLYYGTGYYTIMYKTDLFKKWGFKVPNTTKELAALFEDMKDCGVVPSMHFQNGGYWHSLLWEWAIQYAGPENFYQLGADPKLSTLTDDNNGIKQGLDAMWSVLGNRKNYYQGSSSMIFTTAQTKFLLPSDRLGAEVAMMVNGSWLENEMRNSEDPLNTHIACMKTPVLSTVIDKCETINDDATLSKVIEAVDSGKTSYDGVSEADFNHIKTIRTYEVTNAPSLEFAIPNYAAGKEGAKKFVAYFYSDKGLKLFFEKTGIRQFASMDDESFVYDTTNLSEFQKSQLELMNRAKPIGEGMVHNSHEVFFLGGMSLTGNYGMNYAGAMTNSTLDYPNGEPASVIWAGIKESLVTNWATCWGNAGLPVPEE